MLRLLLRPLQGFAGAPAGPAGGVLLARADRSAAAAGWRAQLQRAFDLLPAGLPVAALTRQLDCGDAALHRWLRADPAHVRADMSTARLVACGAVDLGPAEAAELLRPLKPLFGDSGCPISAPVPQRWYVALPRDSRLPEFSDPHAAMGEPLDAHLPAGELGRRWRQLLNEAQVILHNHPLNAERIRQGKLPVNSLWFWGAGTLPDHVRSAFTRVATDDVLLRALAGAADAATIAPGDARAAFAAAASAPAQAGAGALLVDLRDLRDPAVLERDWLAPALAAAASRVQLDFGDGVLLDWQRRHRWRLWRAPRRSFGG